MTEIRFNPATLEELEAIVAQYPVKRGALIPALHLAVREFGAITPEVEAYLAEIFEISVAQVHEVVTFYTLLPRKPEGEHHVRICHDLPCALRGAEARIDALERRVGCASGETSANGKWSWERVSCLGSCEIAPMMQVDDDYVGPLAADGPGSVDEVLDRVEAGKPVGFEPLPRETPLQIVSRSFGDDGARKLAAYRKAGGYRSLRKAVTKMQPADVRDHVKAAKLRGLGGAGFPAGVKWGFVPKDTEKPVYLVVNADEGEPGTFKDRYILEWDPHRMIEGMVIAAYAIGARRIYVYIRGEYVRPRRRLEAALEEAREAGFIGEGVCGTEYGVEVTIHVGAGAYICGEETALLESLEGKKGWPRLKPPFPAIVGAFGCPTIVNNVETLAYVPEVLRRAPKTFADLAVDGDRSGGLRVFSLSGAVQRPGPYELPHGTPLRDLIYEHGGGLPEGRRLKAVIPGGASAAVLTAKEADEIALDFDALMQAGSMGGSGAVIVIDDATCIIEVAYTLSRFFAHESCGQCTPCREGTGWLEKILRRILAGEGLPEDMDNLLRITENMCGTSICPLSEGDALPMRSYVRKFTEEYEYHIREKRCDVKERLGATAPA